MSRSPLHEGNLADGVPCLSQADCELFPECSNALKRGQVSVVPAPWAGHMQRGLAATASMPAGTFVASFGELKQTGASGRRAVNAAGFTLQVRPGRPTAAGGCWTRRGQCVQPAPAQEARGHLAGLINHTCCVRHANCYFVPSEQHDAVDAWAGSQPLNTVWARLSTDVCVPADGTPVELLADYGTHFRTVVPDCHCCACCAQDGCCQRLV